jgi:serine/threonine-protein kinase
MDERKSGRFGRYEILAELGRGAMGVVYKARDPKINRVVAVKTISMVGQSPEEESEYRERFFREAEAAGRLSHPGIVTIFDVGEEPETRAPYIVMEFVGGQSLENFLSQGDRKLPVERALQLTSELAEALDCAHAQGVVHRDLKPENILLTEDGHAKIADFGVAKLNLSNHTLAGRALGTPAYMSPEQLNGEAVDGRSDLFSLGVILYTMLTGHRPFQGNSAITVSFKVVNRDPIPATILNAELPEGFDDLIGRAIAKERTERYQSGAEMLRDIRKLKEARDRLSKANLPVSASGRTVGYASKEESRSSVLKQIEAVPVMPVPMPRPLLPTDAATANLLKKIRNKSYVGVVVLAGLFIFGLWVISFGPQGVRPKAAASAPATREIAREKTPEPPVATEFPSASDKEAVENEPVAAPVPSKRASVVTTPKVKVVTKSSSVAAPAPSLEKVSKPVPAKQIYPTLAKAVATNAITVSPATATDAPPATLQIEVDHQFAEANLSIWVDGQLAYTHKMEGTNKKRLIVFHHVQGHELHTMPVPAGKHSLRVQVTADVETPGVSAPTTGSPAAAPNYNQSSQMDGDFVSGQERVLHISFKKHGDMNLELQ